MREIITTGQICLDDEYGFTYYLCKIEYCQREDETYVYTFTPNYSVMDLLSSELFQGIPGLALELKKKTYVRENMTPVFITERTPGENRENLWELLEQCDMDYLNRLEWLIRTDTKYSGDPLYVKRAEKPVTLEVGNLSDLGPGSKQILQKLLDAICKGGIIRAGQCKIDDTNRKDFYYILREIYAQEILTNILPK